MQASKEKLLKVLIQGRLDSYVSKNEHYNPYLRSDLYKWHFEKTIAGFRFSDSYRGFNPYGGVEYVYFEAGQLPLWSCDYVGYVIKDIGLKEGEVYHFLKEARGKQLKECNDDFFSDYEYGRDDLVYKLLFQERNNEVLEKADIYYRDHLIAQHIASGQFKRDCF